MTDTPRDWLAEIDVEYSHPSAADNLLRALAIEMSKELTALQQRGAAAEAALREIAKGEGRFSRDPLSHAWNTIEDMKAIAVAALAASPTQSGQEEKEKP